MSISKEESKLIRDFIKEATGITYRESKDYFLELKLAPILKKTTCKNLLDFYRFIKSLPFDDPLFNDFIDAITINETSFFRDGVPFTVLKEYIFPEIRKSKKNKNIHILSVPSSTGQEPYSIAMIALEVFPDIDKWNFKITSGDISEYALFRAKNGEYKEIEINRGLNQYYLNKYFTKTGEGKYKIKDMVKKLIDFHRVNVLDENSIIWKKKEYDIVFFRNIMIYFDVSVQRDLLMRIKESLLDGGYLFMGASEIVLGITRLFERKMINNTVVYINNKG